MPASFTSMDSESEIAPEGKPKLIQNGRKPLYYDNHRPHSRLAGKTPGEAYGQIGASNPGGHAPQDLITQMAA